MKTAYLTVEGPCFAENGCARRCENICPRCLSDGEEGMCRFFGFVPARSAVSVTDKNGVTIAADTFFDSGLTAREYERKELEWAASYARIIENDN